MTADDSVTRVSRDAIASVEQLIRPYLRRTPVVRADRADFGLEPGPLVLKLEHLQHSGSFKARGAFTNLLLRDIPAAGVVAASGGNHGAAVAYAAMKLGMPARIFVPEISSPAKIARIRGYAAELVIRRHLRRRTGGKPGLGRASGACPCTPTTRSRPCSAPARWRSSSTGRPRIRMRPSPRSWPALAAAGSSPESRPLRRARACGWG